MAQAGLLFRVALGVAVPRAVPSVALGVASGALHRSGMLFLAPVIWSTGAVLPGFAAPWIAAFAATPG